MGSVIYRVYAFLTKQRLIAIMLTSFIRQYCFSFYKFPNDFNSLANSFFIAMCHLVWLLSRKYGTVWYHPASSKLWYLTPLSFVNFQEKLTGTSSSLFARAKPACSACCVFGARCTFCVNRGGRPATANIKGLVLADDITRPPEQMIPFMLVGGLCRPPALTFTTGGWHRRPLA
jgi:hypothetical protein